MKHKLITACALCALSTFVFTGCATSQQTSFVEEVKKAEAVVANAHGLENHTKQADKYLLPNVLLEQTKVLYINWSAAATDSILLRFGEADVISVARDATDTSNLKMWEAIRNADADKAKADSAETELKKFVAESYAKNKTTSKLTDDEMFNTVVGKIAQEDYVAYKTQLKAGEVKESDFENQKAWLEKGKANIAKVAAEQKKRMDAIEKRLAKAEKEAEDAKRKINLTIQYYTEKGKLVVEEAKLNIAKATLEEAVDKFTKDGSFPNKLAKEAAEKAKEAADKDYAETKAAMGKIESEFPQVTTVFNMPPVKLGSVDEAKATSEAINKELEPWKYAADIGGKRFDSFLEVKKWAKEAQKTLDEVAGE